MYPRKEQRASAMQYIEYEAEANVRHEFVDTYVYQMAGSHPAHVKLVRNLGITLPQQIIRQGCHAATTDQLVKTGDGNFFYPDAFAVCGEEHYTDDAVPALTNFMLIIEVTSTSTQGYDRGEKFRRYKTTPSLREYLLVAQEQVYVEHHIRGEDGVWQPERVYTNKADVVELISVPATLKLDDIYYGVL
jgi:Uma2 family endonuclease